MSRYISKENRQIVVSRQGYKCANRPDLIGYRLNGFECPLWRRDGDGYFQDELFQIDHVIEFSLSGDSSIGNLQALCPGCHAFKTRDFNRDIESINAVKKKREEEQIRKDLEVEVDYQNRLNRRAQWWTDFEAKYSDPNLNLAENDYVVNW